ncbi:MAG: cadherin domain-containing protein [Daejeonella sp.]|uniref:cadherin domain-containing protein n=1 Tax=Daejeonella sp. TaxID=2805397 RepID=UPI0027330467|nr:cadherin domain-containing protein [Daejeonella sp.]MDP3469427.1 cadherin domain-containing protein [Daejeonella sp.]
MCEKQCLFSKNVNVISQFTVLAFFLLFAGTDLFAQRIASVSGNWHDIATWGGEAVPSAAETVSINSGITVTINATGAVCSSISFVSNSVNSALNISGAFTLDVTGDISYSDPSIDSRVQTIAIGSGIVSCANLNFVNTSTSTRDNNLTITTGSLTVSGTIAMPGATTENALTCTGNSIINLGGDFTGTGTFTAGTSTLTLNGTGSQLIRGTAYRNIVINKASGVTTFSGTTSATGRLTLTSGTLNLDGATTVGSLEGSSTITSDGAANRVLTIGSDNTSTSFSGIIQNGIRTIALTKSGSGTLTLNTANTYTGATTISAGTIQLGAANVLSDISAHSVSVTGTLDLNGFSETIGSLAGAGTVTSTAAGALVLTTGGNNTTTTTFSGIIQDGAGTLDLTKAGTGIMVLSGLNSYTGVTTVSAGTLTLGAAGNGTNSPLGTIASGTTVNTGAALNLAGFSLSTLESLTLNGTGIASAGALNNTSTTLSSTYTGSISLGSAASIVTAAGGMVINTGTITGSGFGLTLGGTGNGTMQSLINTGSGTLTKIGTGIWTLLADNEFTGLTTISAGTLRLGTAGNATNGPLGTVDNGVNITAGALDLNGFTLATAEAITLRSTGISAGGALTNSSATAVDYSGLVTIGAATSIATSAGDLNLTNLGTITGAFALTLSGSGNGSISSIIGTGAGTVVKTGTGSWTLSGASTYTGVTTISVGTLKVGANNAGISNSSAVTVTSTLDLNGFNATIGSLAGAGTVTSSQAGSVTLTTGGNNTSTVFSGIIQNGSGTLNLTKAGTLIFTVSGLSTYTGLTTINTGTIALGAAGDGTNSPLGTIDGGTRVNTGAVLNVNGITLSTSEPLALNGTGIAAAGALINGSATLSADYSGLITLESASSIVATTAARELNITNPGTITGSGFGLTLGGAGIGTMSSIIGTGAGTLTKIGAGTWTLSSANTFTGGATLSAGILNINHSQALGTVDGTFTITAGTINNTSGSSINTLYYPMAWNGSFTFTGANDLNLGTGAVTLGASIVATIAANNLTVGGIVSGSTFSLTKAGNGTLSFGSNDVTISSLTISAGTLLSTSGNLNLKGNFSNSASFSHNSGTLSFTGTVAQTIGGTVVSQVFHDLVVNKSLALTITGSTTSITVNDYTNTLGSFTPPAIFNINGNTLLTAGILTAGTTINATGNWTNNGGTFTPGAGTVNFNGTAQAITGSSNHNFNHFTINPTSTLTASSGIISIAGNWINDGAFVHNSGTVTFTRTTPQTLGGANSTTFYNLIENGLAGKTTLLTNTSIANDLTITAGTLDIGLFTSNGNGGTFSVANSASAIFQLEGAFPTGFATVTLGAASVITYSGAKAQVIYPVAAPGYGYLNITNTVGATAGGNLILQNTLTISSGAILDASNSGNYDISLGLNWTNNGGTFLQRAGTVTFTGAVAQAINGTDVNQTFHHLHVNKTGVLTVPATLNINGNLTLSSGTLTAGTSLFIGGNMTNNGGVFTAGLGTVTFNGTTQAIAGAVPITFRNITINSGSTLTGPAAMTISGEWNNSGSFAHNNGQVTFTSTTSAITSTNTTESFYNLILNKTAANVLSTGGSIITLNVNNFTQTLGNFTPPATLTINGNAVFTAGTFTAGTTTNIAGDWTKATAAIFTPGTNTVNFNGGGAQTINGTSTSQTFYDLIVNKSGGSLLNTGGSTTTLTVNDLTITLGDFTAPAAFTINGNALLTAGNLTSGTNLTSRGDWTNNGGSFAPGTNTLNFTGTGAQLINGTVLSQTFYNVIVNKTALTLLSVGGSNTTLTVNNFTQTQGDFTFTNTLDINGFLTLTAGTFTSGTMLNARGNWTNNSTFVHSNGTVNLDGILAQAIAGSSTTSFNNLTVSNTVAAVSVNTNTNIAGTLNMNGTGSLLIPGAAVVINNAGAVGTISGNGTIRITRIAATADYLNQYKFSTNTLNSLTLDFSGAGAQTVNGGLGDFGALTLSGSGAKTLPAIALNILGNFTFSGTASATALASITVGANVILGTGTVFTGGAFTHNIAGNWTNNGGTFTSINSTVNFNNTTGPQNINGTALTQTFFNILLNNNGQTLSLSGGTTTLSVGGDWTNNGGIFSGGAATVSFTGISKTIDGTSSTDFPIISIANGATITLNNSNTSTGLNLVSLSVNSSFTHGGTAALLVNGDVNIGQPTTSVRNNSWIINAGSATVSGLITLAGANVIASRIGRIALTTGTLNANGGITFIASAAATKVIDMSGGAAVLKLKGALTVPALSSTLTAGSSGSIINYLDTDPQTINFFSSGAYNNLRINNTSTAGASLSAPITTTNLMGNLFVGDTNTGSLFDTGDFNIALNNSQDLTIYEGSVINAGNTVISPATLATITVNGLFKTSNTSGFSGSVSAAINSANSPAIVLGTASTVEYTAAGGGQSVSPLVYNNLTMSNTSGNQTLSGNVTVTKTLSLNTGTMSIGANILTLNGPAIAGTPNSLSGNTTSSLVFGGSTLGITIPSSVSDLNNLTINNSNGVSLNADVGLTTNLLFSAGKLITGSNKLILNSGATITGAGQGTGWVNGNLQRNFSNTDPGIFEIGDLNYYSPLTLTFSGLTVAGNILGSSIATDHPNISGSGIKADKSINRYWTLTNSGVSFTTADLNFNWNTADNDAGIIPGNLRLAKYSGAVWIRPAVSGATTSSIQANGISSLSDFVIGEIANDFSPVITSNGGGVSASLSISENGTSVSTITATDADVVTTLSYSLSGGADAAKFSINNSTGVLSFIAAPDFEAPADADANNVYVVTVRASDGTNFADQTINVTILNVNEFSPLITSNGGGATAEISLPENSSIVTTVVATDADTTTPVYSLNGGADAAKFTINSSTGVLSFISAPDFEAPADADANNTYIVTVRASDGTNNIEQTITVIILNANDNSPLISSNGGGATASISLPENSTLVTTVVATDADNTSPVYSINGGPDATKFSINSSSGVLSFISAPDFEAPADADANNVYVVKVRASDGANFADQTISISITDLNDNKPLISQNQVFEIQESSPNNTIVGSVQASDNDAGTVLQNWTIISGNSGNAFTINPTTGILSVLTQASLQYELIQAFNLNLSVTDGLNISDNQVVKINLKEMSRPTIALGPSPSGCKGITAINLPYSSTSGSPEFYSISWNAAALLAGFNSITNAALTASSINITIPAQAASSTYSGTIIVKNAYKSSISYAFDIKINALPSLVLGQMPTVCKGTLNADISFTSASAAPNSYSIIWDQPALSAGFVNVDPGTSFPLGSFAVNIPVNAPAAIYTGSLFIKNSTCSAPAYPIQIKINDLPEIPIISGLQEVYVNKTIQLSASAQGGVWSSSNATIASVDPVSGLVSGKSNGKVTISYSVKYSNSCSNNALVDILVSTENSVISLNWVPLQVYGNSTIGTLVGTLSASSINQGAVYSFSLVPGAGSTDNSLFEISGNEIRIARLFNITHDKTFSIRVRATDQNGLSEDRVLSVNVIHVNQPPTIAATANMVICSTPSPQVLNLNGISPGPEPGQNVSITVSTDNINLFNTLNVSAVNGSNAALDYTLKDGLSGIANITLILTDNGGTANGGKNSLISTFTITVNPAVTANISSAVGVSISKGQTVELIASGGNSYAWANAAGIISGQNTDKLIVRPAENKSYQVTVTNSFGCTAVLSIALNVIEDFITLQPANIMSPNGDGINDTWIIENIDMYPDNEVRVYDKAGRLIFYKKGYTNTWDATLNGSYLAEGTYYYYVDFGLGLKKLKGYITIVRD